MSEQINIDKLELVAKAATPGPWSQAGCRVTAAARGMAAYILSAILARGQQ